MIISAIGVLVEFAISMIKLAWGIAKFAGVKSLSVSYLNFPMRAKRILFS